MKILQQKMCKLAGNRCNLKSIQELFETLDIFEVPINNDNNDFRKMKEDLLNKRNIIFPHMKINMIVLSKMSKKTKHCLN